MYLDMPPRMSGQPNIYKMDKALHFGVKELLKKTPYTWWPPKQYRLYQLGRFDLYPIQQVTAASAASAGIEEVVGKAMEKMAKEEGKKMQVNKTNVGCFHLRNMLSLREQQVIVESLRQQCLKEPQKYKFSKCDVLAAEEEA